MNFYNAVKVALRALVSNKLRSFLTMLGIIIGVGSVIGMISLGQGAQKKSLDRIQNMGTNMFNVRATYQQKSGARSESKTRASLTVGDADAIEKYCKKVVYASPQARLNAIISYKNNSKQFDVMGGDADYYLIRDWKLDSGRFYSEKEVTSAAKVAVLGQEVVLELFNDIDPIGKTIRINRVPFKVIGVLEEKGLAGWGWSMDDNILMPYTTIQRRLERSRNLRMIKGSAVSQEETDAAINEVTILLRQRHKIKDGEPDDFEIRSQAAWIESSNKSQKEFTLFLGAVASVSLLVGGIGIMNIMLVSVTERIREIGIRMAIGAKRRDILLQFVIEAITLSSLGGIFGIILGFAVSIAFARIAKWPTIVSTNSIIISILFSSFVGVFFGFYPAWKASQLDPIDALRKE